jgi:hypothetical protein
MKTIGTIAMKEHPVFARRVARSVCILAALVAAAAVGPDAPGAERTVLGESFTATW